MAFPNPQDYNEAIQNPSLCFSDGQLRSGQVELTPLGLPRPYTGAFASVYKMNSSGGIIAVRCFHNEISDLKTRYEHILSTLSSAELPWASRARFMDRGIRVHGEWYPLVEMDWVDGLPLDRYLAKHGDNQAKINKLSKSLRCALDSMLQHGIAHGDLQHGNILVVGDEIKLIDYDGMFVRGLERLKSAELGHANYQHPYRSRDHFGLYMDNFPAWLIQISLMCIATDPELLEYGRDRECILFTHADLIAPFESQLFNHLRQHRQEEIRQAVQTLIKLLRAPVECIPYLDASIDEILDLPELNSDEQIRLIEEISQTDELRFAQTPPVLSALEQLSTRKRATKSKVGRMLKQASAKGEAMLGAVFDRLATAQGLTLRADMAFCNGRYKEAVDLYSKALAQHEKETKKSSADVSVSKADLKDYKTHDELCLRLGICHLLNNNAAASVHYFRTVLQRKRSPVDSLEACVGLMMAYCQLNRVQEAEKLILKDNNKVTTETFGIQTIATTLLRHVESPLSAAPGLHIALKMVASEYQESGHPDQAVSIFETVLSLRDGQQQFGEEWVQADSDLDLLLRIGQCHLLGRRAERALWYFNRIVKPENNAPEYMFDRATVGLAVAFRMMFSRQDVVKAIRSSQPERLYNCLRRELDGPLGELEELSEVICSFAAELGENEIMGGLRMATRLAADSYKRQDDKKVAADIKKLLNEGKFLEAHELATEDILKIDGLVKRFSVGAQSHARELTACGDYEEAFSVLRKYHCSTAIAVEGMEVQILRHVRTASRGLPWNDSEFQRGYEVLESLVAHEMLSDSLCGALVESIRECLDRSDDFIYDLRLLADLIAGHTMDGASNKHVLNLRQFAFLIESGAPTAVSTTRASIDRRPVRGGQGSLGEQFAKPAHASTISARSRKMEADVMATFWQVAQTRWDADKLNEFLVKVQEMKRQKCLTPEFCDRLAGVIQDRLTETSALNRWSKSDVEMLSEVRKAPIRKILNALMDIFATVTAIDAHTLRKLGHSIQNI